jgi:hypothetical protein
VAVKQNVLKSQLPLLLIAATAVVLTIIYFVYQILIHSKCDSIFEQTENRLRGNLEFIKIKGELVLGREKVQELSEGPQKVALHLKTCCIAQEAGTMKPDKFQVCMDGAKDYETKIVQVANNIEEVKAAEEQQNPELAKQKTEQAQEAANEAISTEKTLGNIEEVKAAEEQQNPELAKQKTEQAKEAASQAISTEKILDNTTVVLSPTPPVKPPPIVTSPVKFEKSSMPAITIEKFDGPPDALDKFHIVKGGTDLGGTYQIKYQPKPDTALVVEPGTYDVLAKTNGGGTFLLLENLEVKEGTMARINPNAILGSIVVDPLTRKGFPEIKEIIVFDAGKTGFRLIRQRTKKPGAILPIIAGTYDVECKTADGSEFVLVKNIPVKARESKRIMTDNEIAGFVVYEPKVSGLDVEAIYALRAGTNQIAAKTKNFGTPIMVYAGESYDIALKQSGGTTPIKSNVTPQRGALTEIR